MPADAPSHAPKEPSRAIPSEGSARGTSSEGLTRGRPTGSPRTARQALPLFFRHGSPCLLAAAVVGCAAARIAVGGFGPWDLAPLAALALLWPLQEWLIHVLILHWKPRRLGRLTLDFRVPRKHRAHHRDPWNYEILFIPLHSFLYSIPIMVGLWLLATPSTELALTGITGHLALTFHYEAVHFLVHTRVQPRTTYYQRLWRNHRLHHFKNERYWYGVTRLEADRVFRTDPAPDHVSRSPTVRTLHVELPEEVAA